MFKAYDSIVSGVLDVCLSVSSGYVAEVDLDVA
jgi:hypothetical protein